MLQFSNFISRQLLTRVLTATYEKRNKLTKNKTNKRTSTSILINPEVSKSFNLNITFCVFINSACNKTWRFYNYSQGKRWHSRNQSCGLINYINMMDKLCLSERLTHSWGHTAEQQLTVRIFYWTTVREFVCVKSSKGTLQLLSNLYTLHTQRTNEFIILECWSSYFAFCSTGILSGQKPYQTYYQNCGRPVLCTQVTA